MHPHPYAADAEPRPADDRPREVTLPNAEAQIAEAPDEPTILDLEGESNLPTPDAPARTAPSASRVSAAPAARRRRSTENYYRPSDRDVPIEGYLTMTVPEIIDRLEQMNLDELRSVQRYEGSHRRRKTLMVKLERLSRAAAAVPAGR